MTAATIRVGAGSVSAALAGDRDSPYIVVLGHGAGQGMDSAFMRDFHAGIAERGALCVRFNFLYTENKRRVPDARPLLEKTFRAAADFAREQSTASAAKLVLGGKSMGGRMASHLVASGYGADGLLFLGYPLHPPGKPEKLRDEHLYGIGCPMLFLSGTADPFAERELLQRVVERIGHSATLEWLDGGDHSLRVRGRRQEEVHAGLLDRIGEWLRTLANTSTAGGPRPVT